MSSHPVTVDATPTTLTPRGLPSASQWRRDPVAVPVLLVAAAIVGGGAQEFTFGERTIGVNTAQIAVLLIAVLAVVRVVDTRRFRFDALTGAFAVLIALPVLQALRDGSTILDVGGAGRFVTVALLLLAMPQFARTDAETAALAQPDADQHAWDVAVVGMGVALGTWTLVKVVPTLNDQLGFYELKDAVSLPLGNHNYVAAMLVSALAITLIRRPGRDWLGLAVAVITLGLAVTLSRGGWLSAVAILAVLAVVRRDRGTARIALVLGVLMAVLLGVVVVAGGSSDRLTALFSPATSSRIELWAASWDAFLEQPLLGVGITRFPEYMTEVRQPYQHAHSMVLESLAATGIVGAIAYLGYWAAIARRVLTLADRRLRLVIGLPLLGLFLHAQVDTLNYLLVYEVVVATLVGVAATQPDARFVRVWSRPVGAPGQ